jgi:hypothetical protein
MGDAQNPSILSLDQVTQLISQAKSAGASPLLVGVQLFNSLGGNVSLSGSTLTQALANSGVPVDPALTAFLTEVQNISKTGNHVSITLSQDTELLLNNTRIRFAKATSFDVVDDAVSPALNNVVGVAGHKIVWVNVQSIQLVESQGRWSVKVITSVKTLEFELN